METNIALLQKHIDEETRSLEKWKKFQADLEGEEEEGEAVSNSDHKRFQSSNGSHQMVTKQE